MHDSFLTEIDEVLESIPQERSTPKKRKEVVHTLPLFSGLFFFLIFVFTIAHDSFLIRALSTLSFIVFLVSFSMVVADVFASKSKEFFHYVLAIGLLLLLGISYFILYEFVLGSLVLILTGVIAVLLFFTTAFYLLHVYLGYLRNREKLVSMISGAILLGCWLLLFVQGLYQTSLTFFLLVVGFVVTLKVVGDFSAKFKDKK